MDKKRIEIGEKGERNGELEKGGIKSKIDIEVKNEGIVEIELREDDEEIIKNDWRGKNVEVGKMRKDEKGKRRNEKWKSINRGGGKVEKKLKLMDRIISEMKEKREKKIGKIKERIKERRLLRSDRGNVDGVGEREIKKIVRNMLGKMKWEILMWLRSRWKKMRSEEKIGKRKKIVLSWRIGLIEVNERKRKMEGFKRRNKIILKDKEKEREIENEKKRFNFRKSLRIDNIEGIVDERSVESDEIGERKKLIKIEILKEKLMRERIRKERIERKKMNFKEYEECGEDWEDIEEEKEKKSIEGDLKENEEVILKIEREGGGVGIRKLEGERENKRNRVLGGGDRIEERSINEDDKEERRGRNIEIVEEDKGEKKEFKIIWGWDKILSEIGGRKNRKKVILEDELEKILIVIEEIGKVIEVKEEIIENMEGSGRKIIG